MSAPGSKSKKIAIAREQCNRVKKQKQIKKLVYTVWVYLKGMITEKTIKEESLQKKNKNNYNNNYNYNYYRCTITTFSNFLILDVPRSTAVITTTAL